MAFERGQRLMLKIEAAGARFALDATSVLEVAPAPAGGAPLHGHLALEDLSVRLGGLAESDPRTAVVLDTSPTLGLRVGASPGVADATGARYFMVPEAIARAVEPAVRGVLELDGALHFELDVESLAARRAPAHLPALPALVAFAPQGPLLVFRSGGQRFGVPLSAVRQVVHTRGVLKSPFPGALVGLVEHGGRLWPVWALNDTPAALVPALAVLVESEARCAAFVAEAAEGLRQGAALEGVTPIDVPALFS